VRNARARWIAVALLALLAAGAAFARARLAPQADVGAGFVAQQICSCVYVGGRDLEACRRDLRPDMAAVRFETLESGSGIRAWVPLLARRTARVHEGMGCTLE
jgi:hypothetical protein